METPVVLTVPHNLLTMPAARRRFALWSGSRKRRRRWRPPCSRGGCTPRAKQAWRSCCCRHRHRRPSGGKEEGPSSPDVSLPSMISKFLYPAINGGEAVLKSSPSGCHTNKKGRWHTCFCVPLDYNSQSRTVFKNHPSPQKKSYFMQFIIHITYKASLKKLGNHPCFV